MSHRKSGGFNHSVIKAAGEDWSKVRQFKSVLRRLEKRKVTKVEMVGPLAESKIAWKVAALQQALLYRITELASGCATMWNSGNVLCSVLAARALMETVAVILDFEAKLEKYYKANDFGAMNALADHQTFASRDEKFTEHNPEFNAKSVLTYIDRLENRTGFIGARDHYERLSEFCHPNSFGHYFAFGSLDTNTGTVTFSKLKLHGKGLINHVLAAYLLIGLVENAMDRLNALVLKISKAHPSADSVLRIKPIRGTRRRE